MAESAHITPSHGITSAMAVEAHAVVEGKKHTIMLLAKALSAAMQDIHGGRQVIQISHEAGAEFVFVRADNRSI